MNTFQHTGVKWAGFPVLAIVAVALYLLLLRAPLGAAGAARLELVLLGGLALVAAGLVVAGVVSLVGIALSCQRAIWARRFGGQMLILLVVVTLVAGLVFGSQWAAHTPAILGSDGQPLPGSIASLEKIRLGGVDQWLILRGHDTRKPVLLFLSGGPGASEAARVLRFNSELEKHFVVVIWEQRGCGKSYPSLNPRSALTIDQYVSDIVELTDILRERFDEQKTYLVGHSWGAIIGLRAAQARPDLFHAYVGTAQMYDALLTVWQEADRTPAFAHAWLFDHFVPIQGDLDGPCFEGWTLLAALAAQTTRLRIGLMVAGNTYRHPAVHAHMAATVDVISGGPGDERAASMRACFVVPGIFRGAPAGPQFGEQVVQNTYVAAFGSSPAGPDAGFVLRQGSVLVRACRRAEARGDGCAAGLRRPCARPRRRASPALAKGFSPTAACAPGTLT